MAEYISEFTRVLKGIDTTDEVRQRIISRCTAQSKLQLSPMIAAIAICSGAAALAAAAFGIQKHRSSKSRT